MIRPEKAADLFSAKPDQGMNRSADQVRATCRVYVDAGRLPDEGLESIIRLFNLGRSRGYSFDQTGALVDYSGATISRLFAGKYEGALDKVVQQIDTYLELEAERAKMKSDRFIENGSFMRLNYMQLSYSLDPKIIKKAGLTQLSFYVSANNLFCLTGYSGADPEVGYGSYGVTMDSAKTPPARSFTVGATIQF